MRHEFGKVIDGISKYIDKEIYSGMNDWQEFAARVMVGRIINNQENVKDMFINNGFLRTFDIVDAEGFVDVESLAKDIKRELSRKEKITFAVPMFGRMTFTPADVDTLYRTITGEELRMDASN